MKRVQTCFCYIRVFFKNSEKSTEFGDIFVKKITVIKPPNSYVRAQHFTSVPGSTQVTGKTIKLIPIHASVIHQIPEIHWIKKFRCI